MVQCAFIKPGGQRCKGIATTGATLCYSHDPSRTAERTRNARKGGRTGGRGRSNPSREITELKAEIRAVTRAVLTGELETGPAAIGLQGLNTLLRALEVERRTFDISELMERMDHLEARAERVRGA
jgi:hypothetical protein